MSCHCFNGYKPTKKVTYTRPEPLKYVYSKDFKAQLRERIKNKGEKYYLA